MKDITLLSHLKTLTPVGNAVPAKPAGEGFTETLKKAVDQVNESQVAADRAVDKLQTGESRNLHEVMISLEKADISMRLLTQVRNRVIDAYQEIMRMQV